MNVVIYSKTGCPYCVHAKRWMAENQVEYTEIVLDDFQERQQFYADHLGTSTMPQIFVDDKRIGGYTDLIASDFAAQVQAGRFDADF